MAGGMIGRGNGRKRGYRPMAEINITPMVDVMLVLLIVFMVTAPMIEQGVNVNLPAANAKNLPDTNKPLVLTVNAQDQVYLNGTEIALPNLVATLQQASNNDTGVQIYVRGDDSVSYGDMVKVMVTIANGGFTKVALQTKQPGA